MNRWVFGYGSLIWRVDFPYEARRRATLNGWRRRFWQGSHDHRGTPEAPGRVATLAPAPGARCVGMAYLVDEAVFDHLDYREKNGYERVEVSIHFGEKDHPAVSYIAAEGNPAFLGPAPLEEIAGQIARCRGLSGGNADYLFHLADALEALQARDRHVSALAGLVERSVAAQGRGQGAKPIDRSGEFQRAGHAPAFPGARPFTRDA